MAGCVLCHIITVNEFLFLLSSTICTLVSLLNIFVLIIEILYSILTIEIFYSICNFPALVIGCGTHVSFFTPLPNQRPPPSLPFFFSLSPHAFSQLPPGAPHSPGPFRWRSQGWPAVRKADGGGGTLSCHLRSR